MYVTSELALYDKASKSQPILRSMRNKNVLANYYFDYYCGVDFFFGECFKKDYEQGSKFPLVSR